MSSRKRQRKPDDAKCVFFPGDVEHGLTKTGREPPSLSSVSSAKSWEKRGDSFWDTPSLQSSRRKLSAIRKLVHVPALAQSSTLCCNEDPVHIAWSSSDNEQSDDETQKQHLSRVVAQQQQPQHQPQRPGRLMARSQSYTRALHMLCNDKGDLPVIDTDSDLEESEEDFEKDSGQQISDCESSDEKPKDFPLKSEDVTELEISGYVSDGEDVGGTSATSRLDSEIFPLQTAEGSKRSVSDWVRSAQAMLQTPQKTLDMQSKTPEDSAKKKRKLQSGGLAERLNRLQCRQRSAISFWKHQSICDTSAATTTTVDRTGVLVLEVLEVHEECSMQLAHCEHHRPPGDTHQHSDPVPEERARVLVLFNRETAAQLIPAPRDIIHIYPPWQSLSVEGFSCPIILNTHFSQKVCSASKPADMSFTRGQLSADRRMPYYLGKIFGLLDLCSTTGGNNPKQVAALCSFEGSGVLNRDCVSLLEAIEGLGQAGSVEQDVEVVVQRVYSITMADRSPVSILKPRVPLGPSTAPPPAPAEKGKTRLCVLVQDGYGMFSVVQFHPLPCNDDLRQYCRMWEGKTCVLRGIKVVQRVTRERSSRLFSLIDSLWPPAMPLKDHGNSLSIPSESRAPGAAPSFCYLLSGQPSSVKPTESQTASPLYLHPTKHTLRDILQNKAKTCRCSFVATVLHKRMQSTDVGQGEVWLLLTDPSLQEDQPDLPCSRTAALCVNTSCVLTSSVLEALTSPSVCRLSFRDAIKENDVLLCVEPHLILETTPNSLCSVIGVIVGVDENTAYTWPACSLCGSDNLKMLTERPLNFHCVSCKSTVDKPDTKIQLEVFLSSSSLSNCTIKVKLQQKTIMSVLNATALKGNEFPGYDVENVLGKEVGPIAAYVRVVTRKPAHWIGLEEIGL
ncbi:DNA repair-scaffolding protein [Brachyistius frenatus]|uniref:DNA repair-scaffolding protein n=1 Tax=Brachyistius frenatus TaxID=100188 RepID=UPI0037E8D7EA